MSADTSDPALAAAVAAVHDPADPATWLVAGYASPSSPAIVKRDAGGEPALPAVRKHVDEAVGDATFAYAVVHGKGLVILRLGDGVGGVKRAKAIVHARAFAALFPDYLALVTLTKTGELTDQLVAERLGLPLERVAAASAAAASTQPGASAANAVNGTPSQQPETEQTAQQGAPAAADQPPPHPAPPPVSAFSSQRSSRDAPSAPPKVPERAAARSARSSPAPSPVIPSGPSLASAAPVLGDNRAEQSHSPNTPPTPATPTPATIAAPSQPLPPPPIVSGSDLSAVGASTSAAASIAPSSRHEHDETRDSLAAPSSPRWAYESSPRPESGGSAVSTFGHGRPPSRDASVPTSVTSDSRRSSRRGSDPNSVSNRLSRDTPAAGRQRTSRGDLRAPSVPQSPASPLAPSPRVRSTPLSIPPQLPETAVPPVPQRNRNRLPSTTRPPPTAPAPDIPLPPLPSKSHEPNQLGPNVPPRPERSRSRGPEDNSPNPNVSPVPGAVQQASAMVMPIRPGQSSTVKDDKSGESTSARTLARAASLQRAKHLSPTVNTDITATSEPATPTSAYATPASERSFVHTRAAPPPPVTVPPVAARAVQAATGSPVAPKTPDTPTAASPKKISSPTRKPVPQIDPELITPKPARTQSEMNSQPMRLDPDDKPLHIDPMVIVPKPPQRKSSLTQMRGDASVRSSSESQRGLVVRSSSESRRGQPASVRSSTEQNRAPSREQQRRQTNESEELMSSGLHAPNFSNSRSSPLTQSSPTMSSQIHVDQTIQSNLPVRQTSLPPSHEASRSPSPHHLSAVANDVVGAPPPAPPAAVREPSLDSALLGPHSAENLANSPMSRFSILSSSPRSPDLTEFADVQSAEVAHARAISLTNGHARRLTGADLNEIMSQASSSAHTEEMLSSPAERRRSPPSPVDVSAVRPDGEWKFPLSNTRESVATSHTRQSTATSDLLPLSPPASSVTDMPSRPMSQEPSGDAREPPSKLNIETLTEDILGERREITLDTPVTDAVPQMPTSLPVPSPAELHQEPVPDAKASTPDTFKAFPTHSLERDPSPASSKKFRLGFRSPRLNGEMPSPTQADFSPSSPTSSTGRIRTSSIKSALRLRRASRGTPPGSPIFRRHGSVSGSDDNHSLMPTKEGLQGLGLGSLALAPSAYRTVSGGIGYSLPSQRERDAAASVSAETAFYNARQKSLAEQNEVHEAWRRKESERAKYRNSVTPNSPRSPTTMLYPDSRVSMAISSDMFSEDSQHGLAYDDPEDEVPHSLSLAVVTAAGAERGPSPVQQLSAAASAAREHRKAAKDSPTSLHQEAFPRAEGAGRPPVGRTDTQVEAEREAALYEADLLVAQRDAEAGRTREAAAEDAAERALREAEASAEADRIVAEHAAAERQKMEEMERERVELERQIVAERAAAEEAERREWEAKGSKKPSKEERERKRREKKEEMERQKAEEERMKAEMKAETRKGLEKGKAEGGVMLRGWVTVQTTRSLTWRRRYFHLLSSELRMYKGDHDATPVNVAVLTGATVSKDYEESQVRGSWQLVSGTGEEFFMFADSPEDKDTILDGLTIAIG